VPPVCRHPNLTTPGYGVYGLRRKPRGALVAGGTRFGGSGVPVNQVDVASEFMQNYRYGSPFVDDTQIAAVGGPGAQQTVFSIGSDGNLYMVVDDPGSDTGWMVVDLGQPPAGGVAQIAVAADSAGIDFHRSPEAGPTPGVQKRRNA
jgi:hypothetical protein